MNIKNTNRIITLEKQNYGGIMPKNSKLLLTNYNKNMAYGTQPNKQTHKHTHKHKHKHTQHKHTNTQTHKHTKPCRQIFSK